MTRVGDHPNTVPFVGLVAPATTAEQRNTIRSERFPIACWRMDDPDFDFDSSFVVPSSRQQLLLFGDLFREHPAAPVSIFGHADPTGNDEDNKALSGRRAI